MDDLAAYGRAGPVKLKSLQRSDDINLDSLLPHPQQHTQKRVRFAASGRPENHHIRVLILCRVKHIDKDRRAVAGVNPEENTAFVAQFISREGIAGTKLGGHHISL